MINHISNRFMALTEEQKRKIESEEVQRIHTPANSNSTQKHGLPALLSFFIPGLGQLVKGQAGRGILIFIGVVIGLMFLVIPGIIIWLWQIADAYNKN